MKFIPEPASDATRYAYGLTDKKPGWDAYAVRIALVVVTILLIIYQIG